MQRNKPDLIEITGIGLSTTLQLTPQKMAECWETFSLNQGAKTLDDASFPSFRLALIKLSEVAVAKRATPDAPPVPSVTPNKKLRPTISDKSHLPQYNARKNVGAVVASFNPQLDPIEANDKPCSIDVACFETNVPESYRTHFTTLDERARVLEDQLEQAMDLFAEKLDDSIPWEAVGVPRQEKIRCVGRICNSVGIDEYTDKCSYLVSYLYRRRTKASSTQRRFCSRARAHRREAPASKSTSPISRSTRFPIHSFRGRLSPLRVSTHRVASWWRTRSMKGSPLQ